jgi:hypothetical protein
MIRNYINLIESFNESFHSKEDDSEDDSNLPWNQRWKNLITLPAGKILYHGTSEKFHADDIEGPAWFTSEKEVAKYFANYAGKPKYARILRYKLTENLQLPRIDSTREFQDFKDKFWVDDSSTEDMIADIQRAGLPGWYIADNYRREIGKANADDILIINVERYIIRK